MIPINSSHFTPERWRNGSLKDLSIQHRYWDIISNLDVILKYCVGFCKGENLYFRPKKRETALMFLFKGNYFWCHIMNEEFLAVRNYYRSIK